MSDKKKRGEENRAADEAFLEKLERWFLTAPDSEILQLMAPTDNSLVELYRTFGYAPGAWTEGMARMRAELKARKCNRDGVKVKRSGAAVEPIEAEPGNGGKKNRKLKDTRPRWGEDERRIYDIKIHDLIMARESDRGVARKVIEWAKKNPKLQPYKTPSDSMLQKWAKAERKFIGKKRKGPY